MTRRPAVVFDIGNVLIRWDPRHLFRRVFDDEARMEWFLTHVCSNAWNLEQDRGRPWAEAVAELTERHPEWRTEIEAFDQRWAEMVPDIIPENVAVLETLLDQGWPTYCITNFSAEKFTLACERFPFLTRFDGIVVSGHERVLKPEPAIYRLLLDRYGLSAPDCIFIDDSAANAEGARAVGMQAIHFTPGLDLVEALSRHDVPAASMRIG